MNRTDYNREYFRNRYRTDADFRRKVNMKRVLAYWGKKPIKTKVPKPEPIDDKLQKLSEQIYEFLPFQ